LVTAVSSEEKSELFESTHRDTGVQYELKNLIGDFRTEDAEGPQAFWTRVPTPFGYIKAHFHRVAGYHVFIAGEGRVGDVPVGPGGIHYTDAYTAYAGNIAGGAEGYEFLEVRTTHSINSYYMPGSEDVLEASGRTPGRQYIQNVQLGHDHRPQAGEARMETLIATQNDGLGAYIVHCGAGSSDLPVPAMTGTGRYYIVADGSMKCGGKEMPPWSCAFIAPGEETVPVTIGPSGADILVLDFGSG
jgi:hypothetical protein